MTEMWHDSLKISYWQNSYFIHVCKMPKYKLYPKAHLYLGLASILSKETQANEI